MMTCKNNYLRKRGVHIPSEISRYNYYDESKNKWKIKNGN
jgi:hypothetical protein